MSGERSVTVIRAWAADPPVLLMDEPRRGNSINREAIQNQFPDMQR